MRPPPRDEGRIIRPRTTSLIHVGRARPHVVWRLPVWSACGISMWWSVFARLRTWSPTWTTLLWWCRSAVYASPSATCLACLPGCCQCEHTVVVSLIIINSPFVLGRAEIMLSRHVCLFVCLWWTWTTTQKVDEFYEISRVDSFWHSGENTMWFCELRGS